MKKILKISLFIIILLTGITNIVNASTSVNLTIRDGSTIIFQNTVPLPPTSTITLNTHSLNADSVLSIINSADILSPDFSISNLQYYDSFGSFYLKCITSSVGKDCDNWQYAVNNIYPSVGMDKKILSGGENIYLYFGPQNKISLSSNKINTTDTLTATTQKYDYQNNKWIIRTGVTVGLTQPDPNSPFSPTEIQTAPVNKNGQAVFSSIVKGSYNVGVKEDFYFPTETLTVTTPPLSPSIISGGSGSNSSSGGAIGIPPPVVRNNFNIDKALNFLVSQQKENGSFGKNIYTDWTAIALASGKNQKTEPIIKLKNYLSKNKGSNISITDFERHSMALMALGLNPYNTNNENYIKKITDSFDGKQFGDINKDNDDIFALIVLKNAGFSKDEDIIKKDISFVLGRQKENGSWDNNVDMTGAGLGALSLFNQNNKYLLALLKAKRYLTEKQKSNGSFGNVSSTSWAINGILALSNNPGGWIKNKNTPLDYLTSVQNIFDGGIKVPSENKTNKNIQNRIWQTSYAITALSGKTWNQIMQKFEKPITKIVIEKKVELEQELKTPTQKTTTIIKSNSELEQKLEKILSLLKKLKIENKKILRSITVKNILKKSPQNTNKNKTSIKEKIQNQATVIDAITSSQPTIETKTEKRNWFMNFLNKIFSIF